jgi:hypothetical protein
MGNGPPVNSCADCRAGIRHIPEEDSHESHRSCRNDFLSLLFVFSHTYTTRLQTSPWSGPPRLYPKSLGHCHSTNTIVITLLHKGTECAFLLNPSHKKQPLLIFERRHCLSSSIFQIVSINEPAVALAINGRTRRLHCNSSSETHLQYQNQTRRTHLFHDVCLYQLRIAIRPRSTTNAGFSTR